MNTLSLPRACVALSVAIGAAWHSVHVHAQQPPADTPTQLRYLSTQRVFFGHQSVGDNLLEGLQTLAAEAKVPLQITEMASATQINAPVLGHTHVAENTQPLKKLRSFEQAMGTQGTAIDIAMLKFCYIDFQPQTDVAQLFAEYQRTLQRLQTAHPHVKWVHVTTPLTTVKTGWKTTVGEWLGKTPYGLQENAKREAYNQLLRQTYGTTGLVFDLAKAESTQPNGQTWTHTWKGKPVAALYPGYSHDGEHLNAVGQKHVATALVDVLAQTGRKP